MKKIISTTILVLLWLNSFAFYYDYWNQPLYSGGPYVNAMMSEMPYFSKTHGTIEKQYITDSKLTVSTSVELSWYNFFRRLGVNYYWADWIMSQFKYERYVYYAPKASSDFVELKTAYTSGIFDVSCCSERAPDKCELSSYTSQYNSHVFTDGFTADISDLDLNTEYKLKVVYSFTPVPYSEHDNYHYDPAETTRYVQANPVAVTRNMTDNLLLFVKAKVAGSSVINVNGKSNPYYDTGSGGRYLVYNDQGAAIALIADTVNLPQYKSWVEGTTRYVHHGYGVFVASIGATSSPVATTSKDTETAQGCGEIFYGCSRSCNGVTNPLIEFLADNSLQTKFLQNKGYNITNDCFRRRTNILQRSLNDGMTAYDEYTVEDFELAKRENFRMSRIYHLRDLNNVIVNTDATCSEGSIIKVMNSAIYTSKLDPSTNYRLQPFFALGYQSYSSYNLTYIYQLSTGKGVTSNTLEFEIVSKATFPALSSQERKLRQTCVSDSLTRDGDYIHLVGKGIQTGNYSVSLYSPEYMWEISFDGQKWEPMNSSDYSKYIIDRHKLKYVVVMDKEKDLLVHSTILKNREKVMFRQKAVLNAFSSTEYSSLYNYKGADERWYISVSSSTYYTYTPVPILADDNFTFYPSTFPAEQYLCSGDELSRNKISFKLKSSGNVTTEQISNLETIADYKVYELRGDTVGRIVSNTSSYTMNWEGTDLAYRCVISWCRDSIFKDVRVVANPIEVIIPDSIQANVAIVNTDAKKGTALLLCRQNTNPEITIQDIKSKTYKYYKRVVVPYVAPDTLSTDFNSMTRTKIVSYMNKKGWDYQKETGTSVDDAGLTALRAWCRVKESQENQAIVGKALAEWQQKNAWELFDDGITAQLKNPDTTWKCDTFYIKKVNLDTKCESDSVRLNVTYFAGIENNTISFSTTQTADTTYIVRNNPSPQISGEQISGGYGKPTSQNEYVYSYRYIIKPQGGVWRQVGNDIVVSGDESKEVGLDQGAFIVDKNYSLARVVYSRNGSDLTTQVSDTSNVLQINVIDEIDDKDIVLSGDGECAGKVVTIAVAGYDPSAEIKQYTRFVWSASDPGVTLVTSGEMDKYCYVYNTRENFSVEVYREDTLHHVKSPVKIINVTVASIKPQFTLVAGDFAENILSYPDEKFWFQTGTRFQLKNTTEGADSYLWNLELQYYTGLEVEGLKSYIESPVCYLYNPGQNKIRLTAKNSLGCEATVTAENIYIQSSVQKNSYVQSYFEPEEQTLTPTQGQNVYEVYPTITNGESVAVRYSGGEFTYVLTNMVGQVVTQSSAAYKAEVDFTQLASGSYILTVMPQNQSFKIIRR